MRRWAGPDGDLAALEPYQVGLDALIGAWVGLRFAQGRTKADGAAAGDFADLGPPGVAGARTGIDQRLDPAALADGIEASLGSCGPGRRDRSPWVRSRADAGGIGSVFPPIRDRTSVKSGRCRRSRTRKRFA